MCLASQNPGNNYLRDIDGRNTFGEINVKGPADAGDGLTTSVDLTFKFVRRDDGSLVTIPWMQFSLFDFDQINPAQGAKGREAPNPPLAKSLHTPCYPRSSHSKYVKSELTLRGPFLQCVKATGFVDYALSSGPGVVDANKVTTSMTVEEVSNNDARFPEMNFGARVAPQASSPPPHAATPARRLCA